MTYTSEFELFWKAYPARWDRDRSVKVKRKKRPAFEKWLKLSKEERQECLGKRKRIWQEEGNCPRDCVTWLNQYGWEDIDLPEDKWVQVLPDVKMKEIAPVVNLNDERNKQRKVLGL